VSCGSSRSAAFHTKEYVAQRWGNVLEVDDYVEEASEGTRTWS
jgi:hypothetical protein